MKFFSGLPFKSKWTQFQPSNTTDRNVFKHVNLQRLRCLDELIKEKNLYAL